VARLKRCSVHIGFDPREADAFAVARLTAERNCRPIPVRGIVLSEMVRRGLYWRPTSRRDGKLWDDISGAAMSTEFAISRFLTPHLAGDGWAMFADADVMFRSNLWRLFEGLDESKAAYCVKHNYKPANAVKMDGQAQSQYNRKLWSAVCIFNCDHPSNKRLTVDYINTVPGRDLHAFKWLDDSEIGDLSEAWHWVPGHSSPDIDPKLVHFSEGIPSMVGYQDQPFADEWRAELVRWAT